MVVILPSAQNLEPGTDHLRLKRKGPHAFRRYRPISCLLIIFPLHSCKPKPGRDRLPQGQTAVIRRDQGVAVDREPPFSKRSGQASEEGRILKGSAAKGHCAKAALLSDPLAHLGEEEDEGLMKAPADESPWHTGQDIGDDAPDEGGRPQDPSVSFPLELARVTPASRPPLGHLELYCRLAFVSVSIPDSKQR